MTDEQYVEDMGSVCPHCYGDDIQWHDERINSDSTVAVSIPVSCQLCGAQWTAWYYLKAYEDLRNGDPKKKLRYK